MIYTLQQLQSDVMARLGESVRSQASLSQFNLPGAEDVIRLGIKSMLPIVGKTVISEANLMELSGGEPIAGTVAIQRMPCGLYAAEIALPEDLIRITSVKMEEWRRDVVGIVASDEDYCNRQWSAEPGIAGCPERPSAYLVADEASLKLRAVGSRSADDSLSHLLGWRVPVVDADGNFHFPASLYPTLIDKCFNNFEFVPITS